MIDIMKEITKMYAILEIKPVTIFYPKGQPSANPIGRMEWDILSEFKYRNDFETIYHFGPYRITDVEVAGRYNQLVVRRLHFYRTPNMGAFAMALDRRDATSDMDKILVELYQNVKLKSEGKAHKNPFEESILDNVYALQLYVRNSPMDTAAADALINELHQIKMKLLATQNIDYVRR